MVPVWYGTPSSCVDHVERQGEGESVDQVAARLEVVDGRPDAWRNGRDTGPAEAAEVSRRSRAGRR